MYPLALQPTARHLCVHFDPVASNWLKVWKPAPLLAASNTSRASILFILEKNKVGMYTLQPSYWGICSELNGLDGRDALDVMPKSWGAA